VRKLAFSELLKMLFNPQPFNPKKIEVIKATGISIHSRHRAHFQIDGEYKGKIKSLRASILHRYVSIVLP
jgi:diacylglycerol kinase family enzyme